MIERRRIEAAILKHVYDTLKTSHGVEIAKKTIADAVRSSSIEQAKEFAAKVGGKTSTQTFVDRQALWKIGGAMEMEIKEQTETSYVFNVTRCRYAEMIATWASARSDTCSPASATPHFVKATTSV